eukprot:GHVU01010777.1.p1 GENE.GHVU01010777.1~~GHVU01010777.1.p1  ORF type:complete len:251 (+),score=33.72 GHVU01010777.1:510-1262(+)
MAPVSVIVQMLFSVWCRDDDEHASCCRSSCCDGVAPCGWMPPASIPGSLARPIGVVGWWWAETSWYVLKAVSKCVFMAYMTNFMTFVKATEAARTPIYCVWGLMLGGEAWLKAPAEALWWDYAWLIHARDLITETWRLRVPRVLVSSLGWAKADAQRFVLSPVEATWLWRQACFTVAAILLAVTWLCYEEPHMRDARECDELSRETEESIRRVVDKRRTVNTLAGPLKLINGEARNLMERGDAAVAHLRG